MGVLLLKKPTVHHGAEQQQEGVARYD